eukprot:10809478-Alexandrium_andersonii.AAC.1
MSASLVGSEMCIRDSVAIPLAMTAASSALIRCTRMYSTSSRAEDPSVSYTHLTLPTICSV